MRRRPATAGTALEDGIAAYNRADYATAFRLLTQEADRGDSDAEVNLGYLYARGQGVAMDQLMAFRLYERSAAQGNGEGMNALGYRYEFGTGIAPNINKAISWYCAAVMRGNPRAMNNLAILIEEGRFVPRDMDDARRLWRQSAERGHVNSMYNLGRSLISGPAPLDPAEGLHWLRMAAGFGNALAQNKLRQLGEFGNWPPPVDTAALMELQPDDGPPGAAKICGETIS